MPSILVLGPDTYVASFVAAVPLEFGVHVAASAQSIPVERPVVPVAAEDLPATVARMDAVIDLEVDPEPRRATHEMLRRVPSTGACLVTNVLTATATAVSSAIGHAMPVVGISYVPELSVPGALLEACIAINCDTEDAERALALLGAATGRSIETLHDRVALVSVRTLAMVINEAAFAVMEGVADAEDVDIAMKLGTNYPDGPLHWADRIGVDVVVHVLDALWSEYREERYRACVLLRQHVRANAPISGGH